MPSDQSRLQYLFQRYIQDTGTPEEIREFWDRFADLDENDAVKQDLWRLWHKVGHDQESAQRDWPQVLDQIYAQADAADRPSRGIWVMPAWMKAAASVLLLGLLSISIYWWISPHQHANLTDGAISSSQDIKPGGNKAMLTLANGQTIILDSARTGRLTQQGNVTVLKINSGTLAYNKNGTNASAQGSPEYNMLRTPRGGQYQLVLPDGTKVWLNDSSSLRFPTAFSGKERIVQMTGEAYFEVAPDETKPFIVEKGSLAINVLGTHFNVNAYADESAIKVTLLEGLVKVQPASGSPSRMIHPGEQLQIDKTGTVKVVRDINEKSVVAWKDNLFWFEDDDIHTVMRQIARWYDVSVTIQGEISQHFTGSIPRNIMVSGVFEVLQRTGSIHFKIQDKNIIVSP